MKKVTITHTRQWRALPLPEKVDSLTQKSDGCWIWQGAKQQHGYGTLPHNGLRIYVHRASSEVANGAIPDGMRVDHICHVHLCVRPDHLRLVTIKQNAENFSGLNSSNRSGYRGVHWHAGAKKWNVQVGHNGRKYSGGLHSNVEDANAAAIALRNRLHTHNNLDRAA